jgi:hypothetical protein
MLGIPFAAGTEAPFSSVMGKQRCRRIESTYPNCVTSTEQDKPASLPVEGRSTVRRIDGDAGIGIARKRMLPCNRADRRCVAATGQYYLIGNGLTSRWCSNSRPFVEPMKEAMHTTAAQAAGAASHTSDGFSIAVRVGRKSVSSRFYLL